MAKTLLPANLSLLDTSKGKLGVIRAVTSLNIFEASSTNFDPDGFFSVPTFGRVGEAERMSSFGYIDTKLQILHPMVFDTVCRLRGLYKGIMAGKEYVVWNPKTKDFDKSNELEGSTGYSLFVSRLPEIVFKQTLSANRELLIKFMKKVKDDMLVRYVMVMPAGLRDIETDPVTGRTSEAEINKSYRRLLAIAQTADSTDSAINSKFNDNTRWSAQMAFNTIYDTIYQMLEGKKGFIQAKWASRRIFNGTRNVITSMDVGAGELGGYTNPSAKDSVVGMFQTMKGALPRTKRAVFVTWLDGVTFGADRAQLFNPKTLQLEEVKFSNETMNKWGSQEGLEKLINGFENAKYRHKPVTIEGRYLAMIYEDGDCFKIIKPGMDVPSRITDDPEWKKRCRPITWAEFWYYAFSDVVPMLGATLTRYPITGPESVYYTKIYMKTTTPGRVMKELNDEWEENNACKVFNEWPSYGLDFMDSMQPYPTRHAGLGADHDGDTVSLNIVYLDDSCKEVDDYYDSIDSVLSPTGGVQASISIDIVEWVMTAATAE